MLAIYFTFLQVQAALVDYRFGVNYGQRFWDHSGSNNHGRNDLAATTIKSTDRGVYLLSDDARINAPDSLVLPEVVSYLAWVMPSDTQYRLLFRVIDTLNRYHLGRKADIDAVYIHVDYQGKRSVDGPKDSFPADKWSLVTLSYDRKVFRAYINGNLMASLESAFTTSNAGYLTGVGTYYRTEFTVVKGFVWNYVIMSGFPDFTTYISNAGSSTCLIGSGSCSSCLVAIIDEFLGTGCLSTNKDPSQSSFGTPCSTSTTGCSVSTQYSCANYIESCGYDRVSNTCYQRSIYAPYKITNVACTCQKGFVSTNSQCCNSDCGTCNMKAECLTCKSSNTYISIGVCYCNEGYYGVSPLTASNSCCFKGPGCSECTSINSCVACVDPNAQVLGGACVCNDGFYPSSPSKCEVCNSGCRTCSAEDPCLTCWDPNMIESKNVCTCRKGFYASSQTTCSVCNSGCKTCNATDLCLTCWDDNWVEQINNICTYRVEESSVVEEESSEEEETAPIIEDNTEEYEPTEESDSGAECIGNIDLEINCVDGECTTELSDTNADLNIKVHLQSVPV